MTQGLEFELTLDRAQKIVADAQEAFETTIEALKDTVRVLKGMPETGDREVIKDVKAMNQAFLFALEMQEKARVAGCKKFGTIGGSAALDLGAARDEIAFRLACLRDAGDGGDVSGGSDA